MSKCVILVDNSNAYIEGSKFSARQKGVARVAGDIKAPQDPSWRLDFGKLLSVLANDRDVEAAILVGSRPPKNDSVWSAAEAQGFRVITHDRDARNREKAVDTELVAQGTEIICSSAEPIVLVIVSGDRDFLPLVNLAHRRGHSVEMCAFTSAYNDTGEMATSVDTLRPLDDCFNEIGSHAFEWPSETT